MILPTLHGAARCPRLRGFVEDCRGTAAVEMALMLPFLFFLMIGMMELYFYLDANERVTVAAQLTADLIAKEQSINDLSLGQDDTTNAVSTETVFEAVNWMMSPYTSSTSFSASFTNPQVEAASILYSVPTAGSNNLTCTPAVAGGSCLGIDWDQLSTGATSTVTSSTVYTKFLTTSSPGCTLANPAGCYCVLDPTVATPTCLGNQSVVYVRVSFTYNNPLAYFFAAKPVITATAYSKPRSLYLVTDCTVAPVAPATQTTGCT